MDKEKSLFSVISSLIGISLISKVLGFIREFVIAYKLGATSISDAYFYQ